MTIVHMSQAALKQIKKAIEDKDTNAYKAVLDSAYGAPKQEVENTNITHKRIKKLKMQMNKINFFDMKNILILLLAVIAIGTYFFEGSKIDKHEEEIKALHVANDSLLTKNDSLKSDNAKLDIVLSQIDAKLTKNNQETGAVLSVLDKLKNKKDIDGLWTWETRFEDNNITKRTREPYPLPTLKHMKSEEFYKSLSEDVSLFTHLDINDFSAEGYQSHPHIKAPLSN